MPRHPHAMTEDTPPDYSSATGTVLLTHGRSLHCLAAAKNLADHGLRVIACDDTPLFAASFSKHVESTFVHPRPSEDEDAFLATLVDRLEALRAEGADPDRTVVMPVHRNTSRLARHRDRFEGLARVAAPGVDAIDAVFPKDRLVETARSAGVPAPATRAVKDRSSLDDAAQAIGWPAILKLPDGTGGIGLAKAANRDELHAAFDRFLTQFGVGQDYPALLQEAVDGRDYCVTGLFERGRMVARMTYLNQRTFPREGGFGVVRETVDAVPLERATASLMAEIGWNGVAEIDFRWTGEADEEGQLIEVNPRFWGGLFHSIASGVEYPWLLYRLSIGESLPDHVEPRVGSRTKVPLLGLPSLMHDVIDPDTTWSGLESAWRSGLEEARMGRWSEALDRWGRGLKSALDPTPRWQRLERAIQEGEGVPQEVIDGDDPTAVLGLLYVVGSLARYGELPSELRRNERRD